MEDNISNLPAYNKPMDNILNDNFSKLDLSTNNESTNNQLTDNQATNNGSTSTQPANNQTTNDPPSGSQSTNNQTINGKEPGKASLVFEINFSKKSDCGASEILENFLFLGAYVTLLLLSSYYSLSSLYILVSIFFSFVSLFSLVLLSSFSSLDFLVLIFFSYSGRDANDLDYIRSKGITHVLCMVSGWKPRVAYSGILLFVFCSFSSPPFPFLPSSLLGFLSSFLLSFSYIAVDFLHLPISDTPLAQIVTLFPKAIEFISK